MAYLADTHVLLWASEEPENLSKKARKALEDGTRPVWFSIASVWEVAVKIRLKNLKLDGSVTEWVRALQNHGFQLLPIQPSHTETVSVLPLHHRDPFDRLLIAQAMGEDLEVITSDRAFKRYSINVVW